MTQPDPLSIQQTPPPRRVSPQSSQGTETHALLKRIIREHPGAELPWLELAYLSHDPRLARSCLRQVLRINPHNRQALQRLRHLDGQPVTAEGSGEAAPRVSHRMPRRARRRLGVWLFIAASLVVLITLAVHVRVAQGSDLSPVTPGLLAPSILAAVPTSTPAASERVAEQIPYLEQAWASRDWEEAANLLNDIGLVDDDYPGLRPAQCDTYVHWADDLAHRGTVREAYSRYRQALQLCDDRLDVVDKAALAQHYLSAQRKLDRRQWREAAAALQAVYEVDPDYASTRSLLYAAYVQWGEARLAERDLAQARTAAKAALSLEPGDARAEGLLEEIRIKLIPTPTPTPANPLRKRIEVNISQQRMYVWQGDTLLYEWVTSTGEPGRGTAAGQYRVLDKIPEAWASTWSLRMPYWLGVYWAGSMENGIHALPILSNGQTLWAGYLGTPVSYGCIILSTENARTLYHWADVGTPVSIHY